MNAALMQVYKARSKDETARSYTETRALSRTLLSWLGNHGKSGACCRIRDKRLALTLAQAIFLFAAGALGGALNAVAGGGSFIAFPALLFTGVGPVAANATNTLALWVGVTASGGAYRKHLNISRRVMIPLIATSVVGGLMGAILLI